MLILFLTRLVVDIGKGIKFVDHDVDIVAADTMALHSDAFAFVCASDGVELTAAHLALFRIKVCSNGVNTCRIAHEDNLVCQLFRLQMEMEAGTVGINNQF